MEFELAGSAILVQVDLIPSGKSVGSTELHSPYTIHLQPSDRIHRPSSLKLLRQT